MSMRCFLCGQNHTKEYDIQECQNRLLEHLSKITHQMGLEAITKTHPSMLPQILYMDPALITYMQYGAAFLLNALQLKGVRLTDEEIQAFAFKTLADHPESFEHVTEEMAMAFTAEQKVKMPVKVLKKYSTNFFKTIPPYLLAKLPAEVFENIAIDPTLFNPEGTPGT